MKNIFSKLALITFGFVLSIVSFESYLRLSNPGHQTEASNNLSDSTQFVQSDPHLGWFHPPNQQGIYQKSCFRSWVEFNSQGLRDVEHTLEKPEGTYRIVILGDSMAEALQVDLGETFAKQLEHFFTSENSINKVRLRQQVEVINLGMSSFGTDQEYLSLKHYGLQYQPDLVILAFYPGNDVRNNSITLNAQPGSTPKPYFTLNSKRELSQPTWPPYQQPQPRVQLQRPLLNWILYRNFGWLKIYNQVRKGVYAIPPLHLFVWQLGLVTKAPSGVPLDYQVYLKEYPPEWRMAWLITKALIRKVKEETELHGSRFLLVSLTDPVQLAPHSWLRWQYPDMRIQQYKFDKPVKILTEFSREEGIDYLSLLPLFRQHLKEHGLDFTNIHYACDWHLTPLGHQLVAEAIYRRIIDGRLYMTVKSDEKIASSSLN